MSVSYDQIRQHIKKTDTLPTKVHLVKAMVFPVVMYGCESWTVKKAEHHRIDVFELWYWRRLLRVPWTARKSNQSILKEISPEYSLKGLMLKLKLQYFGHIIPSTDSLGKKPWCWEWLKAEGERDCRGWEGWVAAPTQWTWVWVSLAELVMDREAHLAVVHGIAESQTELRDWTELNIILVCQLYLHNFEGISTTINIQIHIKFRVSWLKPSHFGPF